MSESDSEAVAAIRRFNRFHTRWVGALGGNLHGSGFTLTEARVLYELARIQEGRAGDLAQALALDPAYLSRILKRFEAQGWLIRQRSAFDGRAFALSLTESGRGIFASLERASRVQAERIVAGLSASETARLITALGETETLLGGGEAAVPSRSASTAPAIWGGSSLRMHGSIATSLVGTSASRRSWPRSRASSCATSSPAASAASWLISTQARQDRPSWSRRTR